MGEFIPMAVAAAGWNAFEEAQRNQKRQMPYATDEEWETRIAKREKEVQTIKSLQSYRLYVEVFPRGERAEDDPKTPDPADRTVSKRMWKWNVEKWRLQLKSRCVYSRAVLLQCKELLSQCEARASAKHGSGDADSSTSAPSPSTVNVEGGGTSDGVTTLETEEIEPVSGRLPQTVDISSSDIPASSGRKAGRAVSRATAGFQ